MSRKTAMDGKESKESFLLKSAPKPVHMAEIYICFE